MNIGKAIQMYRVERDLSQVTLAKEVGISVSYLSLLERGKRDPSMSVLERIAKGLNVSLTLLIFRASDDEDYKGIDMATREKIALAILKKEGHS